MTNNAILDLEQIERIYYESGCLTIHTDKGSAEAVIHRGMTVEAAVAALRRIASHLEFGAQPGDGSARAPTSSSTTRE